MTGRELKNSGFTLVEMMIAIAVFSVVIAAAYTLFNNQQKTHNSQLAVVDAQQDLRAGMGLMVRDIRLAGYDECIGTTADAGFLMASEAQMAFTMSVFDNFDGDGDGLVDEWDEAGSIAMDGLDNDGDGIVDGYSEVDWAGVGRAIDQPAESVTYGFSVADDANNDGIADAGAAQFGRTDGSGVFNVLMENVHAVAFAYAFDDDDDGFMDLDGGGNVIWGVDSDNDQDLDVDMSGVAISPNVPLDNIRAVQIWVLARAAREDTNYSDAQTYTVGANAITPGDSFRRRLLTATVLCKNMY